MLTPAAETPQELDSPVAPELCEKSDWKDLKMWFLEEGGDVDTKTEAPLVPQGESLKVNQPRRPSVLKHGGGVTARYRMPLVWYLTGCLIPSALRPSQVDINSICVTLEAGVGHRTAPMLLAKSSFHGNVKNWTTLINLYSRLNLEVNTAQHNTTRLRKTKGAFGCLRSAQASRQSR